MSQQFHSFNYDPHYQRKSFEEWRWEFYCVFRKDCLEECEGQLVTNYVDLMKFKEIPKLQTEGFSSRPSDEEVMKQIQFTEQLMESQEMEKDEKIPLVVDISQPLFKTLRNSFNNEQFSDFTIRFMRQGMEMDKLHVHKMVLAQFSDYFRNMFSLGMMESNSNELILDIEEENESSFCRMISSIYDPRILSTYPNFNFDLILLFDKYGFDSHQNYLIENILANNDDISPFFSFCNHHPIIYEIVANDFPRQLFLALNRNIDAIPLLQDVAPDLIRRYVKHTFCNEFQKDTYWALLKLISSDVDLSYECALIVKKRFSHFHKFNFVYSFSLQE